MTETCSDTPGSDNASKSGDGSEHGDGADYNDADQLENRADPYAGNDGGLAHHQFSFR